MTREEAEQIRKRALEVNAQNQNQDLADKEARYTAWFARIIESLDKRIKNEAELGHTEFEFTMRRATIPEKVGECEHNTPYSTPRCGTGEIMIYLARLGFRCDFRPNRWCSDTIKIYLI